MSILFGYLSDYKLLFDFREIFKISVTKSSDFDNFKKATFSNPKTKYGSVYFEISSEGKPEV